MPKSPTILLGGHENRKKLFHLLVPALGVLHADTAGVATAAQRLGTIEHL